MPKLSIEGALGIAAGVILFILDKMGIGGLLVYAVLFIFATALCVDSVVRSDWANSKKRKVWGGIGMFTVYLVLGGWVFFRPHKKVAEGGSEIHKPENKSEPAKAESPKSVEAKSKAKPLKESPLQIGAFDSLHSISVTNNNPVAVHALELVVTISEPFYSMSFQLDRDIKAGDTVTLAMQSGSQDARTISMLADNWKDHVQKAKQLYSGCGGIQLVFFSPSDSRFEQLKAAHSRNPTRLAYGGVSGTLSYLVHGLPETKEEQVPVVAVTTVSNKCPYLN